MCFGVKRALALARRTAEENTRSGRGVYVVGQLVHNRQISDLLAELGIREIGEEDLAGIEGKGNIFIIPSHGKGPVVYDIVRAMGGRIADAVCPLVSRALEKALEARKDGYFILIFGDGGHDEVNAYRAWLGEGCRAVQDYRRELSGFTLPAKLAVIAQTTADQDGYLGMVEWLREQGLEPLVFDTICAASVDRREAAARVAAAADLMLVIGGRNSANTRRLAEYCERAAPRVHWIETARDVDMDWFKGTHTVGITAGASTPEWIIKEVVDMMEEFKDQELEVSPEETTEEEIAPQAAAEPEAAPQDTAPGEDAPSEEAAPIPEAEAEPEPPRQEEEEPDAAGQSVEEPESPQESEEEPQAAQLGEDAQEAPEAEQEGDPEQEAEGNFSEMEAEMGFLDFHPGDVIKGTVVKVSSDEVLVDIGYKSEGIIPAYELAFTKVDPLTVVQVGDEISVEVLKEDRDGNVILSRKNALFEEKINLLEELFENGEPIKATVIDVVKGGLLVDVGMRGFVPASHVERGFVKDLSEYLKRELDFKILELNRSGRKVILSRKALLEEEYQKNKEAFWGSIEEGQTRKGVVKRLTDFGAFVDIGGCDGLLHVSEMGWGKVGKPYDVVSINDEIEVYVLKIDREKEKVSLSLKKLLPNPWDLASEKYKVGEIYEGTVMRGASFGAFIQLEPSLEGLAHISQLARFRVNKVEDVLTEGMVVPVKILDIDLEKRRVSLSIKEVIDLPKLVKDEPEDEAFSAGDAADDGYDAIVETVEESISETVGSAVGEAMKEMVAVAVAEAAAEAADEAASEALSADAVEEAPDEDADEAVIEADDPEDGENADEEAE
ncbi:MAG: bifunctional 4-hydroxy-3-methylbut-2-enyl diphosphate reductase/30S ribosomal protein S1 [Clostridiales bacterium]|nr:bifunctional 4-hydroxy-3-methylbut-2-enyl diphosphate reductase/30S ribosomal protein S1 [Clostridiales bacterium]